VKEVRKKLDSSSVSWLFVAAMFALCCILGALQYRWIGEVSAAEQERLHQRLQADLTRLSEDFSSEVMDACRAIAPAAPESGTKVDPTEAGSKYAQWKRSSEHPQMFQAVAVAIPQDSDAELFLLNPDSGTPAKAAWPEAWAPIHQRIRAHLRPEPGWPGFNAERTALDAHLFEFPIFASRGAGRHRQPFRRAEAGWMVVDLNTRYIGEVVLPELIQQDLGSDYQVDVVSRSTPAVLLYQSTPNAAKEISTRPDASVGLFRVQFDQLAGRGGPPRGGMQDASRWQMNVRHRAGSLEVVVASTRRRTMAVTGAVFLLLVITAWALFRYTRRAERLARLQMDFVAGISHELRTPLAVIYGAAYNLRGSVACNPNQVERYGVLLQQETSRLRDLVDQVLQFAGTQAGRIIREKEPVAVDTLIEQALESSRTILRSANCVVEKRIPENLPLVLADPVALKHALLNLVSNAVKYGQRPDAVEQWIEISAAVADSRGEACIEIRVADRGAGIPASELDHIFDAFFRGRRAIQDQIHGTGLGLNLVRKIVEAHGGTIRVESEPMKQTEFIVRIPGTIREDAVPADAQPDKQPAGDKK
jgi:signal transduction histidine kinase